ncbi:uncharacterized protein [Nicotiana sylvestris]|uniref:uncharacterized protein n=1 Tax=Nicotiana sylvestris TaxID=4096 RepID=UPI00388C4609
MDFGEIFTGIVYGIILNNWYSVLLNEQPYGFFKSARGVKQGDPLSPTLFILAAKALSRGLNALHKKLYFCDFGLPKWSPKIIHLAYEDDTIIFSASDAISLKLVMEVLNAYEIASGQLINKSKSAIYMHHSTSSRVVNKVERITGISKQDFPFTYLGCPIFYARRRMDYYQGLINKVMDKLQAWKGKLLSNGGRAVLISHVIQSIGHPEILCACLANKEVLYLIGSGILADHIQQNINPPMLHYVLDKPSWMLETSGEFCVKSAWEYLRKRKEPGNAYMIGQRDYLLKYPFFMWKELWKRRNIYKHGDSITVNRVIYQISFTLQSLIKYRKPGLQQVPHKWPEQIELLEKYTPMLHITKVIWEYPSPRWVKINTYGASRGNPRRSAIGFVLRNEKGDVLYAHGTQEGTNTEAEARAILEAMRYYVEHDYILIELHTDSILIKNTVNGERFVPWCVAEYVEEIKELMARYNVTVAHTLREGNRLADHLANYR